MCTGRLPTEGASGPAMPLPFKPTDLPGSSATSDDRSSPASAHEASAVILAASWTGYLNPKACGRNSTSSGMRTSTSITMVSGTQKAQISRLISRIGTLVRVESTKRISP